MLEIVFWILAFLIAITVHEAAHALAADKLGDPTPRLMGRLSLNPIVHYDPIGTTLLFVLVIMRAFGAPVIPFGWAKPVQIDPFNLKNPKRDQALISLAGPGANLILALVLSTLLRFASTPFFPVFTLTSLILPVILLNVVLAVFNLIPIHPLDGGKILVGLLPSKDAVELDRFMTRFGTLILFLLIFPSIGGVSPISAFMTPVINFILNILLPGTNYI